MKGKLQHQGGVSVCTDYKSRMILLSPPHSCLILPAASLFSNQVSVLSLLPEAPSASFQNGVKANGLERK